MKNFTILLTVLFTLTLPGLLEKSYAALDGSLTTIELDTPVHFLAADGSDVTVPPGTYDVEAAEEWVRFVPGERRDAVLIEADQRTHPLDIDFPLAMAFPGDSTEEADLHFVMLFLPGGQSLEATGTYSGIRPRGFLGNAFKKAKKTANDAHKKAKSTANQAASNADKAAQEAQKQANQEAAKANQAAQQAQQEAQKQAKQAAAKVQQDVEAAKTAALQAKREVEKTTRRVASRVRQEGNKAQDMVGGFLAPPPTPPTLPRGKFFNLFDHNRTGHAYINSYLLGLTSLYVYEPDLVLCPKGHDCWRQWKQAFTQLFSAGGMTAFHFIKEPFTNTQAAVMSNDTLVVVVFRGSEQNSQDWGQIDAQFPLIPAPNWGTGVMTHRGFTAAFRSVFPRIRDAIRAQNKTGSKRVWLTGHSLGGALAFLHAHALVREAGFQIQGVHTYGAPRVGNPRWNRVYSPPLGAKTQRWVNNADFVTLLVHPVGNQPQQLLRYQHVGQINNIYADRTIRLNDNERSFPPTKYSTNDHNLLGYICPMVSHLSPTERSQLPQLEACD